MNAVRMTPKRQEWLALLVERGEWPWHLMPKGAGGRAVSSRTWQPMTEAGWITARLDIWSFSHGVDWLFTITDAGRAQLVQA